MCQKEENKEAADIETPTYKRSDAALTRKA
jgi:hypothetical protein